jgi:hypothetical protein
MPDTRNHDAHDYAERIRRQLPHQPAQALQMLPEVRCDDTRMKLAIQIARSWPHTDINTAWNTVARSPLNATEKQFMFNELWG